MRCKTKVRNETDISDECGWIEKFMLKIKSNDLLFGMKCFNISTLRLRNFVQLQLVDPLRIRSILQNRQSF